jgi:hypothetical protein
LLIVSNRRSNGTYVQAESNQCPSHHLPSHRLTAQYQKHVKRLQVTGGGIDDDESENDTPDQFMEFYIAADGPDDSTSDHAKNLWRVCYIYII